MKRMLTALRSEFLVWSLFFKYSGFLSQNLESVGQLFGKDLINPGIIHFLKNIILPIGISFYTFQTLSYTIDIYDGKHPPAQRFVHFFCLVTLFPQLVAGPIVRFSDISSQFKSPQVDLEKGIYFFVLGLAKKILIADSMAPLVKTIFDGNTVSSGALNLLGVMAYALQIYYDFSGYSEMAVGLGLMLGFHFPQNFNSPYKASSMTDFWRRWHMSLSFWFRDYVYIKLGGNHYGAWRQYFNLLITMTLCGLWHGAGWNFVLWGFGHGAALVIDKGISSVKSWNTALLRKIWCLGAVLLLWIPFRAVRWEDVSRIFGRITGHFFDPHLLHETAALSKDDLWSILVFIPALVLALKGKNLYEMETRMTLASSLVLTILFIFCVYMLLSKDYIPFLYFQF